jgi:hypothetical protein
MGTKSNDPDKYWRAGIAMPVERRPVFEARLKELGMETVGDLASFFTLGEGVVEALKPLMPAWHAISTTAVRGEAAKRKELLEKVKQLAPADLERLLAQFMASQNDKAIEAEAQEP